MRGDGGGEENDHVFFSRGEGGKRKDGGGGGGGAGADSGVLISRRLIGKCITYNYCRKKLHRALV